MKKKEIYFDVELIQDMKTTLIGRKQIIPVSLHEIRRGLTLKELVKVLELYEVSTENSDISRTTINIRGAD